MTDFLYDSDYDLLIQDGDLVMGNVENQAAQEILEADRGWYFFDQNVGAGLIYYLNDDIGAVNAFVGIRKGLEADGMMVLNLDFVGENLNIEFEYSKKLQRSTVVNTLVFVRAKQVVIASIQSIFDLSLIYYNSIDGVFRIAELNNITEFPPVLPLTISVDILQNNVSSYDSVSNELATIIDTENRGIGHWRIGSSFKIK